MKIGILCAGDEELAPFLPLISNCKITEKAMLKFHAGQIDSVEVVALFSGVCKVNAAIAAQLLIDVFCVDILSIQGQRAVWSQNLKYSIQLSPQKFVTTM